MKIKIVKGNTFVIDTGMTYIPFYKINDTEIIMLDSGWKQGEREGIDEILERNNYKVAAIICSHAHIDHVGNNQYLKEKYKCVIAMPAYEAFICSSNINLKLFYSSHNLSEVKEHFGNMVCETDVMISGKQESIEVCGITFKILHTPGHSPAHICITTPDEVVYLGDTLISYEVMRGAKMPYAFILEEDLKSKEKLYDLSGNKYVVAHKGIYDDIEKLIVDNINFYKDRAKKVSAVICDEMTMEEIFKAVIKEFNISVNTRQKYNVIERMLKSYIEYLNETGDLKLKIVDGVVKFYRP